MYGQLRSGRHGLACSAGSLATLWPCSTGSLVILSLWHALFTVWQWLEQGLARHLVTLWQWLDEGLGHHLVEMRYWCWC